MTPDSQIIERYKAEYEKHADMLDRKIKDLSERMVELEKTDYVTDEMADFHFERQTAENQRQLIKQFITNLNSIIYTIEP